MRIAILALLGGLVAGCSTTQSNVDPAPAGTTGTSSGLAQAYQACQTAYEARTIPNRAGRAQCLNDAENRFPAEFPDREFLSKQQGLRLTLAKRVDSGQMTQAAADKAYRREMARLQAASEARRTAG